mmetsp:Transcript_66259/g.138105  ORF Transcript_66259/g.138105 Transcript_66259/m.138105 type:complete len:93 (-) Transcript_66259:165-443(-)
MLARTKIVTNGFDWSEWPFRSAYLITNKTNQFHETRLLLACYVRDWVRLLGLLLDSGGKRGMLEHCGGMLCRRLFGLRKVRVSNEPEECKEQ